jgi:hypothetical protein
MDVPDRYGELGGSRVERQAPLGNVSGRVSRGARVLAGIAGFILIAALVVAALQPPEGRSTAPAAALAPSPPSATASEPIPTPSPAASYGVALRPSPPAAIPTEGPAPTLDLPPDVARIAGVDLAVLLPGQSRTVQTLDPSPRFNEAGTRVAWGGELFGWPDLQPLAAIRGDVLGWGEFGDDEALLVRPPNGGISILLSDGTALTRFDPAPLYGVSSATWSPERRRLWVESPDWPSSSVSLYDWTADGRRVATAVDKHGVEPHLTASEDERWVAAGWSRCENSACSFWVSAGPVGGPRRRLIAEASGSIRAVGIDGLGRVSVVVDRSLAEPGGDVVIRPYGTDFLAGDAKTGTLAPVVRAGQGWWPLDDGSYVILDGGNLVRLDPFSGDMAVLLLPGGVDPAQVLSVSPDGALVAAWSIGHTGAVRFFALRGGPPDIDTFWTFGSDAAVTWARDGNFALVADGPPTTQTMVRVTPLRLPATPPAAARP